MQIIELIILAALAAVVLYQLYSVLGRRVGRGPEAIPRADAPVRPAESPRGPLAQSETPASIEGIAALRARDPSFDATRFLQGARSAYQSIVKAFADGDLASLKPLLSADVMSGFEAAIVERNGQGRTEVIEFLQPPRADIEFVELKGDIAIAAIRFLGEIRTRSKDSAGEAVDDRRTAEIWTFQRDLMSRNPNWTLIHVDAAEA